ncbi:MAG TPA: ATP-binding protein [Polyangia bacterium]|nr:ATP-binding protein [Polyangia bacterium]
MTARPVLQAPLATAGRDDLSVEGELTVSWIRLVVSGIILVLLGAYTLQDVAQLRAALVLTAIAAFCWAAFSAGTILVLRRRRLAAPWSFVSTTMDIGVVTLIQVANTVVLPLNFANGPITEVYFVVIGLAAIRRSHRLVLFAGLGAAVVHLALSTAFFATAVGYHGIHAMIGDVPFEVNYLDEVATATMLAAVGWVLAQVARRLLAAERQTHDLFEHVPDGILIVDADRRILAVNRSFTVMTEAVAPEIVGRPLDRYLGYGPGDSGSIPPPGMLGNPTLLLRADGATLPVRTAAAPVDYRGRRCVALSVRDVTEQLQLRRKVAQSQKMETLGRLSGGLAQDLGRILDDTLDAARALIDDLDELDDERTARSLARQASVMHDCATRASEVAARLLTFAPDRPASTTPVDLDDLVQAVARICRGSFDPGIEVVTETTGAAAIEADGTALSRGLLNLCINARDAIQARGGTGGTIRMRVAAAANGGFAVEVADDGTGMDGATIERIFDPFFTTKPPGKGTGLGLSMVYGIARQHGGSVTVESTVGAGSTFRLHLPGRPPPR